MFTGIIEALGVVSGKIESGTNLVFWIDSPLSDQLKIDQSISHDGVCLTVDDLEPGRHRVTAIAETLGKTTLSNWNPGDRINLERSTPIGGRLDGHIVQGHVDCRAVCVGKDDRQGSWIFQFEIPEAFTNLIIEKGSISINGTSLTLFDLGNSSFSVAIIPYTYNHTSIAGITPGSEVNIEFDMVGKYINRIAGAYQSRFP